MFLVKVGEMNSLAAFWTTPVDVKSCGLYHVHQLSAFLTTGFKNTETLVTVRILSVNLNVRVVGNEQD